MRAVHFGAGNIGRGFIGETLADNGFGIDFVDVNETIIDELNKRGEYDIELAAPGKKRIHVSNVDGINNRYDNYRHWSKDFGNHCSINCQRINC